MMGIAAYQQQCMRYLNDQGQAVHNISDLETFINEARVQIALSSECLRQPASLIMTPGTNSYQYSTATFVASPTVPAGLGGIGNVRSVRLVLPGTGGFKRISIRAWEWFETYYLTEAVPSSGPPTKAARLQPGVSGTLWFWPNPDLPYQVDLDTVAYPADLTRDTDPDALPIPWQDAVPFFACHLALISVGDRDGAMNMWAEYSMFERRAVQMTTPSRTPSKYPGGRGAAMAGTHTPITTPMAGANVK